MSSQTYINLTASYLKTETQNSRPPVPEKSSSRRRSISCKRLVNRRCSTPLRELSPACATSKALVPYVPKKVAISVILLLFNQRIFQLVLLALLLTFKKLDARLDEKKKKGYLTISLPI